MGRSAKDVLTFKLAHIPPPVTTNREAKKTIILVTNLSASKIFDLTVILTSVECHQYCRRGRTGYKYQTG